MYRVKLMLSSSFTLPTRPLGPFMARPMPHHQRVGSVGSLHIHRRNNLKAVASVALDRAHVGIAEGRPNIQIHGLVAKLLDEGLNEVFTKSSSLKIG